MEERGRKDMNAMVAECWALTCMISCSLISLILHYIILLPLRLHSNTER